ncbi:Nup54 domain-containing protein [Aphelenchoides bicaudatus]|nr:Nup54 domain-containing protein [Aphelenchoides bicaudatus]
MIYRFKRHASFYSVKELMHNETVRLGNHNSKFELIWSPESKYHPEFGALKLSEVVSDRIVQPSLLMSFAILGSILLLIIFIYIKYLLAERQYKRELALEQNVAIIRENFSNFSTSLSTDPLFQRQISTASTSNSRRKSFMRGFREFRFVMFSFNQPSTQPAVQAAPIQPQQTMQQLIQDTATLVKSVSGPEIFNDDRNEVVAKLNQLLAAFGIGQGFYRNDQQPVTYNEKNLFYRFKGVVYNRVSRHTDDEGLVVLLLGVPFEKVNTDESKIKVAEQIDSVFGMNVGVKSIVDSVKAVENDLTLVTITAYEQNKGRVAATTLSKFLNQNDKMSGLQTRLQCKKVFPLVAPSKADREKFLNTPPDGFDPNLWRQGVRSNPDPERFLSQPIYGFDKVFERKRMQNNSKAAQSAILNELLRLAVHLLQDLRQGYALNKAEDKILSQAEQASVNLIGPDALKDRINGVLNLVETDRQQLGNYFRSIDTNITGDDSVLLRQQLSTAQKQLEKITGMLDDGNKTLGIVERKR